MKKVILTAIFAVAAFISCNNSVNNSGHRSIELVSSLDSVSYAIGCNIGKSMKKDFTEGNIEAISAGIKDALNDDEFAIDQDKFETIIEDYLMKKESEKAAEMMKKAE